MVPLPPPRRRVVLADGWYSWLIPSLRPLTDLLERWPARLKALSWRLGPLRAGLLLAAGTRYQRIAVIRVDRGWRSVLLGRALLGRRRKLVVLHFIDLPPRPRGRGAAIDRAWRPIERWAMRRAVLAAQVLSAWEVESYAERFGLTPDQLRFVPFAWSEGAEPNQGAPAQQRRQVVAAGRAFCDWPTLFAAARGSGWPLVVVCQEPDRAEVERLNHAPAAATVLVDIPQREVRELLARAAVAVVPMREAGVSQGQVRLKDAVDCGAPVVASRTRSLEGYVVPDVTAVLVPPGDPEALRVAVQSLLDDPAARERIARAAADRAAAWTWPDYLEAIEALVHGRPAPFPSVATSTRPAPSR